MKKYLIIASAALVALAACNKEVEFQEPANNTDEVVLTFTSERPQFEAGTKTAWDATNSCIVWESTDKIRVGYTLNGNWMGQEVAGTAKFYASKEVTIDDDTDSSVGTFQVPITGTGVTAFTDPKTNGTYKFYSIYPHSILSNATVNDPTSQSITLATTQTPGANTFDHSTDIMVGVTDNMSITGLPTEPIELNWKRVVAHAALSFTNMGFVGTEIPNKITLTFNEDAKVAGSFSVNITDGTIGAGSANEIILEGSGLTVNGTSINAWATVLPVSFSSLNVEIKTDKATYTREIASFTGGAKTFKGNARNTLTINMATASRTASAQYEWVKTDLSAITASDVFVIVGNNGDNYAMSNDKGTSSAPEAVAVTVANDKLTVVPADRLQWTLTKDGSNYIFYPNGTTTTWLYCTNTNNGVRVGDNANKVFTLATSGYLKNTATSRYLGVYTASGQSVAQDWRCYTSEGGNIASQTFAFYVKTAAGPAVTWNLESIAITTAPATTVYTAGQNFDPAGMVVTGHFVDADNASNTKDEAVTGYTITPSGALSETDDHVTITYQGKSVDQSITVNAAPAGNDGSLEHPYTASEASALALNGDTGSYYISGIVTKIQNQYSASYGTANFWIDENGTDQTVFEGYKIKYFGNVDWVEGNAEIALNDEVIIYGTLTVYKTSTAETSSGYLVSLNGKTKGLTLAAPTVTTNASAKQITVAWTAATGTESAVSYVINCGTQSYNATAAGSHTFTMADYGTYNVSVEATASDAVAATINTSATLTDPSAGTPTEYTIEWGASYNSAGVSSYTDSWDATKDGFTVNMQNFNNNNNGWNYVKCGRKNTASVATIITDAAITEAIKTVTITIDALTAAKINSITLYVSSSKTSGWTSAGTFTKATGNQSVTIASPAANKYYKLEFDCASGSSNGLLTLSKAVFSTN